MTDPGWFQDTAQYAAPAVHHAVKHIKHIQHVPLPQAKPVVAAIQGISMLTSIIITIIISSITSGIAYYVGHRGIQGVKNDVANAKNEISKLTGRVDAVAPPTTPTEIRGGSTAA